MRAGQVILVLILGITLGGAVMLALIPEAQLASLTGDNSVLAEFSHGVRAALSPMGRAAYGIGIGMAWAFFGIMIAMIWSLFASSSANACRNRSSRVTRNSLPSTSTVIRTKTGCSLRRKTSD